MRHTWQAPTHTASQNCDAALGMASDGDQTPRMPRRLSTSVRYQTANCGAGQQCGAQFQARLFIALGCVRTPAASECRQGSLRVSALMQDLAGHLYNQEYARAVG